MSKTPEQIANLPPEEKRAYLVELLLEKARKSKSVHPLSHNQHSMWFLNQLAPESPAFNAAFAARVCSAVDVPALRGAFQALIDRHPVLRTTYENQDGIPVQVVHGYQKVHFDLVDATAWHDDELREEVITAYRRPFELENGPVLRVSLFTRSATDHVLLMTVHHIAFDGWSAWVLLDELRKLYPALRDNEPIQFPTLETQYTDFVDWQSKMLAGPQGEKLWSYWQQRLTGDLPVLNLPTDRPRPPTFAFHGASHHFTISDELARQIKKLAHDEGVTTFVLLLSALQVLLYRYTLQKDIMVGVTMSGRSRPEFAKVIGIFMNPVLIRADLSDSLAFRSFLEQTQQKMLEALDHQDYPLDLLTKRLDLSQDMARSPLGHVGFVLQKPQQSSDLATLAYISGEAASRIDFGGLELEYYHLPQQEGQGDLELDMLEASDSFLGILKFNTDIFDGSTIARLADHFQTLLGSIVANPEQPTAELPILTDAERQQVIVEWNTTKGSTSQACIHELFEAQVECTPDKIALRFEDKADYLTYKELNERSDQLARYLRSVGTGPGSVVGLYMHRSLDMVVALLGVLKAGGAYLPLDPAFPVDRLKYMLSDSQAEVMLTNVDPKWVQNLRTDTSDGQLLIVDLNTDWPEISSFSSAREENTQSPSLSDHLAYLIYTSGSTGVPKGVEIPHRAVVNFLLSMQSEPGLSPEDTLLAVTTMSFDIAVLEIFLPLITGAQVVLASREAAYDGHRLIKMLNDTGATIMQATPATWRLLIESGWQGNPQLKSLCGGEALPKDLALLLLDRVGELWNMYGPTETTVWSTTLQIQPGETITIGRPIANTQIYILDDRLKPVPIGVKGELFIGGDGLARGYHNQEELTKEKFLPNPFDDRNGSRLYRTGDLARYHEDGNIEFYGRTDHQVKIRGFRIELGEIEVVLSQHPAVRENIVVTKEDATTEKRLIAYLVVHQETTLTINELRNFMQDKLPNYMIPAVFVFLDSLPLTPNGKTDRKALPEPKALHPESQATYQAPQTDVEQTIATIWQEVLKLEKVGIHDNFLDMGGHSLLMAQVHSKLGETLSLDDLPLVKLFQYATISTLAKYINNQVDELPSPEVIHDRAKRQKAALARQKQLMRKVKRTGE